MISFCRLAAIFSATSLALALPVLAQQAGPSPVKIFILAGQSNMAGQGVIEDPAIPGTLEHVVANDPVSRYPFLVDGSGADHQGGLGRQESGR